MVYGAMDEGPNGQAVVQLMAKVDQREFLVITQPLKQLRANAQIANSFFLILGTRVLLFAASAVLLLSGRMTRPIREITGIAAAIARMDFSKRYRGKARDELGLLGGSINTIAETLSEAIADLQETNEQLRQEMQM